VTISTEIEEKENNQVVLKVEVDAEQVKKDIDRAFREFARQVFIPGFRKGRVPRRVLQARMGMEPVYEQVMETRLPEYFRQAVKQAGIEPVAEPDIEDVEIEEGKPLTFTATVDVKPRVELGEYKGLEIEEPEREVSEEEVQAALDRLRERFARLESVPGKKLEKGDFALIDFNGTLNGVPLEGGSVEDFMFELGEGTLWPEFDEELEGKRVGDILDVRVKMPEEAAEEGQAGQIASFKVIVKEVKVKRLPEPDDDFAREASEFDTMEELRSDIRSKLEQAKQEQAENMIRSAIMRKLVDELEVELSRKMVDAMVERRKHRLADSLQGLGLSLESYMGLTGKSEEAMQDELTGEVVEMVKRELILEEVARLEGLEVEEEEFSAAVAEQAASSGIDKERLSALLEEDPEAKEGFKHGILMRKALQLLRDHAVLVPPAAGQSS
jgi:trigger factor